MHFLVDFFLFSYRMELRRDRTPMKLSEHVYNISGRAFGINSNTYAVKTSKTSILIDAGYRDKQFAVMERMLRYWGMSMDLVSDVLITHAHLDHIGNAARLARMGKSIIASQADAKYIEEGGPVVLEHLFKTKFETTTVAKKVNPGDVLDYGDVKITVIDLGGHTPGSVAYLLEATNERVLFTGDNFTIGSVSPDEVIVPELAFMGGPEHDKTRYVKTLENLSVVEADIVAVGHGPVFYGDSREFIALVLDMAKKKYRI